MLTNRLYPVDEVCMTLITALLKGCDLQECYYWILELYHSGLDVLRTLERIYLDFYLTPNPLNLGEYIAKKERTIEYYRQNASSSSSSIEASTNTELKEIGNIIRNLFRAKSSSTVFIVRQLFSLNLPPNKIYRRTLPTWLDQFPKVYHMLLMSIHHKHWQNICYYLRRCHEYPELIEGPFTPYEKLEILVRVYFQSIREWKNEWPILPITRDVHYLLAIISHAFQWAEAESDPIKMLFLPAKIEDMDMVGVIPIHRQHYQINSHIGDFNLARYSTYEELTILVKQQSHPEINNTTRWLDMVFPNKIMPELGLLPANFRFHL